MSSPPVALFGRIAVHLKLITVDQLRHALGVCGRGDGSKRLGDILLELGYLSAEQVEHVLAFQREHEQKVRSREEQAKEQAAAAEAAAPRVATLEEVEIKPAPVATSASDTKRIETLLVAAAQHGASDLHVHVGQPVLMRVNGRLLASKMPPYEPEAAEQILLEILTPDQRARFLECGDLGFAYEIPGKLRARAAYCRQQRGGVDGVFRILPIQIPDIEDLGLPRDLARFTTFHQGLVLITGPTGCGKTSTLAGLVNVINVDRQEHIISVEDPIEYVHASKSCLVRQRQVIDHTESFSRALRAALREDPDIIVVGELRDRETVSLAITAAETGHLVLGTLHTNNAVRTINRILDAFPPEQAPQIRSMVSASLRGVISQRLVPLADGKGRVAAVEVLSVTSAVSNLIREGKMFQIPGLMQVGKAAGMRLLDDALEDLVKQGRIRKEDAARAAEKPERFS